MRYKARSVAALEMALGSLPDTMRVEVDPEAAGAACRQRGQDQQGDHGNAHGTKDIETTTLPSS